MFDRIPDEGDSVTIEDGDDRATFTVVDMDRHRIDKIRVVLEHAPESDERLNDFRPRQQWRASCCVRYPTFTPAKRSALCHSMFSSSSSEKPAVTNWSYSAAGLHMG